MQLIDLQGASIAGARASYFLLDQKVGKKSRPVHHGGRSPLKRLSAAGRAPSSQPGLTKPLRLFTSRHAERAGVFLLNINCGVRMVFFVFAFSWPAAIEFLQLVDVQGALIAGVGAG